MSTVDTSATESPDPPGPPPSRQAVARRQRHRRNRRRTALVALALVALLLFPILVAGGWLWLQLSPRGGWGDPVTVSVESGWGTGRIADELEEQGVVGSAMVFKLWKRDSRFASGTYRLHRGMGVLDAAAAMGDRTIPASAPEVGVLPGLTLEEVGDRVALIKRLSKERFLAAVSDGKMRSRSQPEGVTSLRGLLMPDSYPVPPRETEAGLAREMVTAFDEHVRAVGLDAAATALGRTPYEVITIASMIQREAKLDEDRPLIAAVIYNRLRLGMPLQIDATSAYAQQVGDPSYDTYQVHGLPPTPISTVSARSLDAAMHPADVSYLFYVVSSASGRHAFANTFEEHQQNVAAAESKGLLP